MLRFTALLPMGSSTRIQLPGGVIGEIESRVQKYIAIKLLSSKQTGFPVPLVLQFHGVRYAISFDAFAFILSFIPNLGSIVVTILPLPFARDQAPQLVDVSFLPNAAVIFSYFGRDTIRSLSR